MVISSHRITRAAALLALAALLAACTNKAELRAAKVSIYDADFAIVYSEVVAAVREVYPNLDDNPATGLIATAWHKVQYNNNQDDPRNQDPAGLGGTANAGNSFTSDRSAMIRRTFIRFDVTVLGGRPWKVRVRGKAAEWEPGNAQPSELRGAEVPHWLAGRTEALQLAIYRRLKKYAIQVAPAELEDESVETVDRSLFGPIPEGAADAAAGIVASVETRDPAALRALLDDEVVWSLGAAGDADTAVAMWQADPDILIALVAVLQAGCVEGGDEAAPEVVCPTAATTTPGYLEWRATLAPRGKVWKLTSFVRGD